MEEAQPRLGLPRRVDLPEVFRRLTLPEVFPAEVVQALVECIAFEQPLLNRLCLRNVLPVDAVQFKGETRLVPQLGRRR